MRSAGRRDKTKLKGSTSTFFGQCQWRAEGRGGEADSSIARLVRLCETTAFCSRGKGLQCSSTMTRIIALRLARLGIVSVARTWQHESEDIDGGVQ